MAFGKRSKQTDDGASKKKRGKATHNIDAASKSEKKSTRGGARFVLLVGDEGGILVYLQGKKVVRRLFAPSPQPTHTEAMVKLMVEHPQAPVSILIDVLDQQYVRQTFPPVSSLSVAGLVKRRLDRDFQAEDLKGSIALGRDKTGRKEWNYLLVSLAKTPLVTEWLDLVAELPNQLKGIYLVPVEGTDYINRLHKTVGDHTDRAWKLFVSHNKVSGFRQVVTHNGKIVFTRVTQAIDDAIAAVIAGNIEQEIINTLEYLRRLGFQENSELELFVVTASEVAESLDLKRFSLGSFQVLTPLDVADALGLEQAALSADRFGDVVMAAAFATSRKHTMKLMTVYGEKLAKVYTAITGIKVVAALGVLVFLGLTISDVATIFRLNGEISKIEARQRSLEPQRATLEKSVSGLNKDLAFKSAVVSAYDALIKNAATPFEFAKNIQPYLDAEHRIIAFDWNATSTEKSARGAGAPAGNNASPALEIKFTIQFDGNYPDAEVLSKEATAYLERMKGGLPQYDVAVGTFPWLRESNSGIEISFDQQQDTSPSKEQSTVEITLKPKPGYKPPVAAGEAP